MSSLGMLVTPEVIGRAGQGLGVYQGLNAVAEYFSLLSPSVNKGFVRLSEAPEASAKPVVVISPDGTQITIGNNVVNRYLGGLYTRTDTDYLETILKFTGCSTKADVITVPPVSTIFPGKNTGAAALAETLYLTANTEKFNRGVGPDVYPGVMGYISICKQHEKFCTGANSQYPSTIACETFLKSLLKKPPTCGTAAIASGNTVACRAKHQFMAQINPAEHCPHIGTF
jgi:hypothetical protein